MKHAFFHSMTSEKIIAFLNHWVKSTREFLSIEACLSSHTDHD